jgi:hypothetical protein
MLGVRSASVAELGTGSSVTAAGAIVLLENRSGVLSLQWSESPPCRKGEIWSSCSLDVKACGTTASWKRRHLWKSMQMRAESGMSSNMLHQRQSSCSYKAVSCVSDAKMHCSK